MLAGVCAGVARRLGVDAKVVRIIAVVLTIGFGGLGVALYLAGVLLIPHEGQSDGPLAQAIPAVKAWPKGMWAVLVIIVAVAVIWGSGSGPMLVAAAVIAVVLWFVFRRQDRPAAPVTREPTPFERAADTWRVRLADQQVPGFESPSAVEQPAWKQPYTDPSDRYVNDGPAPIVTAPAQRRWRLWGLALTLIGASTATVAGAGLIFAIPTPPLAYLSAVIGSLGLSLLVAARESRPPLLAPAAIATAIALITQLFPITGSIGDVNKVVTDPAQLPAQISVAAGDVNLDLRGLQLNDDRTLAITVDAGDVKVQLPQTGTSVVDWQLQAGDAQIDAQKQGGFDLSGSDTFGTAGPVLHVELRQGVGDLAVTR
jgi:phage shock protein PspC (stress-responsive transcriptional regulator)